MVVLITTLFWVRREKREGGGRGGREACSFLEWSYIALVGIFLAENCGLGDVRKRNGEGTNGQ